MFELVSDYQPAGDQPQAIAKLTAGLLFGAKHQVLLDVTGSGKTFAIANVIKNTNRPLVISHNQTLAAQLYAEFKSFSLAMPSRTERRRFCPFPGGNPNKRWVIQTFDG